MKVLKSNNVGQSLRRRVRGAIRRSKHKKTKRSTGGSPPTAAAPGYRPHVIVSVFVFVHLPANGCTVGIINQVVIHDETFPFDYDDVNQFHSCLNATTVKENLATIVAKVDEEEFQRVVLDKLSEVRNSGGHSATI